MKKLYLIAILLWSNIVHAADWAPVGTKGLSAGEVNFVSIDIDKSIPYVAYQDQTQSNKVTVKKFTNNTWATVGTMGFTAGGATNIKIDVFNGTPYVAYTDYGNSQKVSVMKYNGSNWVYVGSAGISSGEAAEIDLKINSTGIPYIAYSDVAGNSSGIRVQRFINSQWENVGTTNFTTFVVGQNKLAFNSNNDVYLATYTGGIAKVYKKTEQGSWTELNNTNINSASIYLSLDIDQSTNTPYLIKVVNGNSDMTLYSYQNNSWTAVGNAVGNSCHFPDLKIINHIPYVAYGEKDPNGTKTLRVKKYINNAWEVVGGTTYANGIVSGGSIYSSLSNSGDTIYVAHKEMATSKKASAYYINESAVSAPKGDSPQQKCLGEFLSDLDVTGEDIRWYNAETGGNLLNPNTTKLSPSTPYYVSQTINGVESPRLSIIAILYDVNSSVSYIDNTISVLELTNGTSYQWYNCDDNILIDGATGPSFTPQTNGLYKVEITAFNGCKESSDCTPVTLNTTSIDDDVLEDLSIYPNPTEGIINISGNKSTVYYIRDVLGVLVQTGKTISQIDISTVKQGVYYLEVDGRTTKLIRK